MVLKEGESRRASKLRTGPSYGSYGSYDSHGIFLRAPDLFTFGGVACWRGAMAASGPSAKRARHDSGGGGAELPSPLNAELFAPASRAALRAAYAAAQPFPHAVLRPLCDDARLRAAFAEMRDELTGTFKETDLFKARRPALRQRPAAMLRLAARGPARGVLLERLQP